MTKNRGWVQAIDLIDSDELVDVVVNKMKIKKINQIDFEGYVYNFSVEDNHNYTVNDVVVSNCHYCYTSALKSGKNFSNIVDKAHSVWGSLSKNDRPNQIAVGGAGESTMHPDWVDFMKTVKSLDILPNYTTNGMHLSDDILKGTEDYCGGVAVSYHPHIRKVFDQSIEKLSGIKTILNAHIIIGDQKSLDDMIELYDKYQKEIKYFVILPYQASGRAKPIETETTWKKTFEWLNSENVDETKFAFGALFYPYLLKNDTGLKMDIYEPEIFSGYRIMDDTYQILRKSSYDLTPKNNIKNEEESITND